MSTENDAPKERSLTQPRGSTRGQFFRHARRRSPARGAGRDARHLRGTDSGSVSAQGGDSGGSFPGGEEYDAAVKKLVEGKELQGRLHAPVLSENFAQTEAACWRQMANYEERFGVKWGWARTAPAGNFDAVQEHFNIVQNWVTSGFDAIIICTGGDFAAMQKVYRGAEEKGTKIYQLNMPMDLWPIECRLHLERRVQQLAAVRLRRRHLPGRDAQGQGRDPPDLGAVGSPWSEARQNGFDQALKENPGLRVVAKADGGYVRDKGFAAAQNLLEAHPNVNAIYGENEEMGLGASQAIDARGLKHWDGNEGIVTIGADGLRSGFKAIREGKLTATIDVGSVDQGLEIIRTIVVDQLLDNTVDKVINVPTVLVDKSNVDVRDTTIAWALAGPKYS